MSSLDFVLSGNILYLYFGLQIHIYPFLSSIIERIPKEPPSGVSAGQINPQEEQELLTNIQEKYNKQISPYYAAARLWTDAIIDPKDTRKWISMGIDAANNAPQKEKFNMGVLQV